KLASQRKIAEQTKSDVEAAIRKHEDVFGNVMDNFRRCIFPEFSAKPQIAEGIPDDFNAAIALFLKQQEKQVKLTDEVASLLMKTELCFGDVFRGSDEYETTAALQAELEALAEKEEDRKSTRLNSSHVSISYA